MNATTYAPTPSPANLTTNSTTGGDPLEMGEGALWAAVGFSGCFFIVYCTYKIEHWRGRRKDKALQKWLASRHA